MATYAKSSKTQEHIFQTAFDLFKTKGYQATSLKDIAQAADVSTGTLYRYFPSKADLLFEVQRNSHEQLAEVAANLPDEMPLLDKIMAIVAADSAAVSQDIGGAHTQKEKQARIELALAIRSETYGTRERLMQEEGFRRSLRSIYRQIVEDAQATGAFSPSLDAEALSEIVSALYFQAIDQSILKEGMNVADAIRPKLEIVFR